MSHSLYQGPEYRAWSSMIQRCTNPNNQDWEDYGGRGIKVCPEWRDDFWAFYNHIGPKPDPQMMLDRENNARGYEPGNVRWVTRSQQMKNRRSSRLHPRELCVNGHDLSVNGKISPSWRGRRCWLCHLDIAAKHRQKKREANA